VGMWNPCTCVFENVWQIEELEPENFDVWQGKNLGRFCCASSHFPKRPPRKAAATKPGGLARTLRGLASGTIVPILWRRRGTPRVVLLKRTLVVNAEESVVVQNLMLAQWRQDLIGEFAEFCSGDEL
jgi:hypothetical protein